MDLYRLGSMYSHGPKLIKIFHGPKLIKIFQTSFISCFSGKIFKDSCHIFIL